MSFDSIGVTFTSNRASNTVLRDINLALHIGETVCLVGASGCGKSTLLNIAAGFITPTEGSVTVGSTPIDGPGSDRVMVFQEDAVFPWRTVRQNIEYGLLVKDVPTAERRARVDQMMQLVDLNAYADAYPRELSGGMKKRCDMARALAVAPESILMDEPFAALDVMTKEKLQVAFNKMRDSHSLTSLFVTHDLEEALFVGDRVAILRRGAGPFLAVVDIPFPRPRDVQIKTSPEFQELRRELIAYITADSPDTEVE